MNKDFLFNEIQNDVNSIDADFIIRWNKYKIDPILVNCIRTVKYGIESVYIVARDINHVILYDDVEEEFGIGAIDSDGILRSWNLYAGLDSCIKCFPVGLHRD